MQRFLTIALCTLVVGSVAYAQASHFDLVWTAISPWGVGVVLGSLLAAVVAGEIARFVKLPRLFGYTTIGLLAVTFHESVLRPTTSNVADPALFFDDWRALYAATVALMGVAVGLHFDLNRFRNHFRTVFLHSVLHILFAGAAIGALLWGGAQLLPDGPFPVSLIGIGVVALLASTSSPSAIYAVNSELRAEGTLPSLQILIALFKNLLVVGGVLALVFTNGLDPSTVLDSQPVTDFALSAGATVLAGVVGGLCIVASLHYSPQQVVLVTASAAAVVGMVWHAGPAPVFLGGVLAGAIAANGSRFGFQLAESLDRSSAFFLAVVFVFAFVTVDVPLQPEVWLFAIVAMPIRGVFIYGGSRLAEQLSNREGGRHLPYSMFAQSLVALFTLDWLAGFDVSFAHLEVLMAPLIVVNLFVGSLLHRAALVRAGVVQTTDEVESREIIVHSSAVRAAPEGTSLDDDRSMLPQPRFATPSLRSARLNDIALRVRQRLFREQDLAAQRFFDPRRLFVEHVLDEATGVLHEHCLGTFQELREIADPLERKRIVRERRAALEQELQELFLAFGPTHEPGDLGATLRQMFDGVERACQVDAQVRAPEEDEARRAAASDSHWVRFLKRLHAANTRFGPRPMRLVPVRALALDHIALALPHELTPALNLDGRFRIYLWMRISNAFEEVSELYLRTLDHLDVEVEEALDAPLTVAPESAARKESEALEAFDRRLRGLEPVEEVEEPSDVEPILADEERESPADAILAGWTQFLEDMPVNLEDLSRDVLDFEADVRRRLALTVDAVYQDFLDDLAVAGTFALPARRFDHAARASAAERDTAELEALLSHWRRLALAFVDRRAMHLSFRDLEHRLRAMLDEFVTRVETELCGHLTYYPAEISERCEDVVRTLGETFAAQVSDADLADAFVQIRHNLSDFLQEDALRSVQEMREEELFANLVRQFVEQLEELVRDQRSLFVVADESFLDRRETQSTEDVDLQDVPFQDILEKHFTQLCVGSLNELAMRVGASVDVVATGLGEVNRIISFNLDAAASELRADSSPEQGREVLTEFALGGIRRAGDNAAELLQVVQDEVDGIDHDIIESTVTHVRTVRRYLFDDSMGRLERLAFEVSGDGNKLRDRGSALFGEVRQRAEGVFGQLARPVRIATDLAQERLSLHEYGREELVADAALATFESDRILDLPLAYRRLFMPTPVEIPELFLPRPQANDAFAAATVRWREGRRTSIVLTGELGTGKTSFLHRNLASSLSDTKMLRWNVRERLLTEAELCAALCRLFGVRRVTTTSRLLAALVDVGGPRVVVVDGVERLFLRTMTGNAALMSFLSLVAQSPAEILWLVSANAPLWDYLATMFSADDFFTDRIDLELLDAEQTEELVMRRHLVSGYRLEFRSDTSELLTPRRFLDGAQERARRRYFKRLFEVTSGHPLTALYYWLASVELTEGERIIVNSLKPLRIDHLRHLEPDKLIGLAQLLMHEELTEAGFAQVMRLDDADARRDLSFFEALNLVVREPGRNLYFRVNEVLHHDVGRTLGDRNIV